MLIIGGGIAAVAAIAAVVVFVVKPFGGGATGADSALSPRQRPPARCRSTRRRGPACSSTSRRRAPRRCASICAAGVHRVRVEADGGLTKTLEVNVVAGKEIAQLVELTKGPDRAAERAAAAAASAAAAPAPPTPGFMIVDAPEDLQIVEDGRAARLVGVGQGRARPRQPPD